MPSVAQLILGGLLERASLMSLSETIAEIVAGHTGVRKVDRAQIDAVKVAADQSGVF